MSAIRGVPVRVLCTSDKTTSVVSSYSKFHNDRWFLVPLIYAFVWLYSDRFVNKLVC